MEKKLLLSLLCLLQIGLIQSAVALPTNTSLSQSDFVTTTELLEKQKSVLVSKIKQNDARIEAIRDIARLAAGPNNPAALFLLPALISVGYKQAALEKEQAKNKFELADLDASLETAYFEQLEPFWKKKLLLSKIEANTTESKKLSDKMPQLYKTSQQKPFYLKLSLLNFAALVGTMSFMESTTNLNPNLKYLRNLSTGIGCAFLLSIMFPVAKLCIASDAHTELENIKKKILELEMKKSDLVYKMNNTDSSLTAKKPTLETLAVVPSNGFFKAIYDAAHFEAIDTEGKKKNLLSKIEATTTESNKLSNEATSLEKTAAIKPFYSRRFKISCASLITLFCCLPVLPKYKSKIDYAVIFSVYGFSLSILASMIQFVQAEEAGKSLEEVKKGITALKKQIAKHSANLATI